LSWLDWAKKNIRYRLGGQGAAISQMEIPPDWNYQQYLTAYGQIGWLFGAVSLIAGDVAEVDWHLYKRGAENEEIDSHPLLDMWRSVNPFQTKYQFLELIQMYLGLVGEAFIVLNFNGLGTPAEMWTAPPQFMHIIPSPDTYISHYEYRRGGARLRLEVPEVIHIFSPNPINTYRGLGTAQSIAVDLDIERYSGRYQQRLFYNDATPSMMIEYPDVPSAPERTKIRKEWAEIHQGWRNARKTGFLWGGAKASVLSLTNRDLELWRQRKMTREAILGAYRIPHSMMGLEGVGSRARVEADEYNYAKHVLRPALTRIREAFNEQLVPLFDDQLIFTYDDPVPENREAVVDEMTKLVPAGIVTREEARVKLGYQAEPESGETFVTPMNIMPSPSKALKHKGINADQKELMWRVYANKADVDELLFKRVFKRVWDKQASLVANNFEMLGNLDQAFEESRYIDIFNEAFTPVITQVFTDALEAVMGGKRFTVSRIKQGLIDEFALEWIKTRSLSLAKLVNGTTYEELRKALATGFEEGESIFQLKHRISQYYTNGYERRATLVARTEVIAASNEGSLQGYEKEGITEVEFYAALDERTCAECMGYHEQVYPVRESHGMIPVHVQCRCTWIPVVE